MQRESKKVLTLETAFPVEKRIGLEVIIARTVRGTRGCCRALLVALWISRFTAPLTRCRIPSWNPRPLYFPNFATAEQCQSIIQMAKMHLKPSSLALREGETAKSTQGIRTSSGMFMSSYDDKTRILDQIVTKIAKAIMTPKNHGEDFNVLRYEIGQSYHSHYDAFNPAEYGPQKSQREMEARHVLFLSSLLLENGQNMNFNYNFRQCVGLKFKPRRGDGLWFYSLFLNGTIDHMSDRRDR